MKSHPSDTPNTGAAGRPRSSSGPTVWSRISAILILPILLAGGLVLAHAVAGNLAGAGTPGFRRAEAPPAGHPERPALGVEEFDLSDWPEMDARTWAERMAGGTHEDPVPAPPGARRLYRMAGGFTFYRLAGDEVGGAIEKALTHYRRAFAGGGWETVRDEALRPMTAEGARSDGARHLLVVFKGGRFVYVSLQERKGAANAVVRTVEPGQ